MNIKSSLGKYWTHVASTVSAELAIRICAAAVLGTALAFIASFLFPLFKPDEELLQAYARHSMPVHMVAMGIVIGLGLLGIFLLSFAKLWRSLRLGLLRLSASIWAAFVAILWLSIESRHPRIAIGIVAGFCVLVSLTTLLRKSRASSKVESSEAAKVDLPVPEDGEDQLGLGEAIDAVVATIVLERMVEEKRAS